MKIAFITGITGQDGSYLTEYLLEQNYKVYGMIRRSSTSSTKRIDHIFHHPNFIYLYGDITDLSSLISILSDIKTHHDLSKSGLEIYNLSAQSHVKVSFDIPIYTALVDGIGSVNLYEAVKLLNLIPVAKIYQASTSELYGDVVQSPQDESTPFNPRSPYAIAKQYAFWMSKNYREAYNMFICNGILFNHTSPRRGHNFVCRKIVLGVANISKGYQDCLTLGNLDARRDWGHAKDYIRAMHLMLQRDDPDDYVIATGKTYSVRQFVEMCFSHIKMPITWTGTDVNEVGIDDKGVVRVKIDPKYFRPTEVELLIGNPRKAQEKLGWSNHYTLEEIIAEMMERDLNFENLY